MGQPSNLPSKEVVSEQDSACHSSKHVYKFIHWRLSPVKLNHYFIDNRIDKLHTLSLEQQQTIGSGYILNYKQKTGISLLIGLLK